MTLNKIEGANPGMELGQQLNWAELEREVVELHDFAELQALGGVIVLGDTSPSKKSPKRIYRHLPLQLFHMVLLPLIGSGPL